ncbi:MAG: hypothetical protein QF632_01885 [Candidatus Woesearchaeota archaeon]|jgi:hypothetical protein|nr:hypothetical protein [Candidatus Woesearchaeota archaeon]MDP7457976.1 hypothetical protein [Candidatus Woesearchaeota archaeon]
MPYKHNIISPQREIILDEKEAKELPYYEKLEITVAYMNEHHGSFPIGWCSAMMRVNHEVCGLAQIGGDHLTFSHHYIDGKPISGMVRNPQHHYWNHDPDNELYVDIAHPRWVHIVPRITIIRLPTAILEPTERNTLWAAQVETKDILPKVDLDGIIRDLKRKTKA